MPRLLHALAACSVAWWAACGDAPPPVRLLAGEAMLEYAPGARTLQLSRAEQPLLRFPADGFQIGTVPALEPGDTYDPYWLLGADPDLLPIVPYEDLRWHEVERAEVTEASEKQLKIALALSGGLSASLLLAAEDRGRFSALLVPEAKGGRAIAWMRLRGRADPREGFYGLGEWADEVNHRGKARPMQMEFDATESANNENHVPVPLLIGTSGWALFVESRRVGLFDVARREADLIDVTYGTAEESAAGLRFHLFAAGHPLDLLRPYFDVTGYPGQPAPWALGPLLWRDESRDQAEVLSDIQKIRQLDLATSAIWIDRPYATFVNTFDFKASQFPDPAAMIRAAHDAGLRLALWHTPYLEPGAEPMRTQAREGGYFPRKSGLLLNRWSEPLDFTNPAAYAFWQGLLGRYAALGVEGYKLDYGEDVVPGLGRQRNVWQFADGSDERTMHHGYTLLYHRAYAEMLPREGGFLLCRTGRFGDQRLGQVIWPGDMDATFTHHREPFTPRGGGRQVVGVGGLPATVVQGLSLSASGFPYFGADTGGYRHSPPDKELYIRWFQQTALSSVMQVGDSSSQPPWEFTRDNGRDTETLDLYRRYARLHLRLFPYEWTYVQRMRQDGRPITRPLGLAYPGLGVHPADTYLFGDDLLVAPVLQRGQTRRQVVLPPGDWIDWEDGTVYQGGEGGRVVEVPAPLHRLPLLARAGAIVPLLRPTIDTLAQAQDPAVESYAGRPGPLHVRIFPGPPGRFVLFDGTEIRTAADGSVTVAGGRVFRPDAVVIERVRP